MCPTWFLLFLHLIFNTIFFKNIYQLFLKSYTFTSSSLSCPKHGKEVFSKFSLNTLVSNNSLCTRRNLEEQSENVLFCMMCIRTEHHELLVASDLTKQFHDKIRILFWPNTKSPSTHSLFKSRQLHVPWSQVNFRKLTIVNQYD